MTRNPFLAAVLSLVVPGLGQTYGGEKNKGAAVIVGVGRSRWDGWIRHRDKYYLGVFHTTSCP